jgi:F-type H+-transporting ATPase subunit a
MKKLLPYIVIGLIIAIGSMFLPKQSPIISIRAEPLFHLGPLTITNSVLTAWLVTLILLILCYLATSSMQLRPGKLQNFVEFVYEGIYNLTESVAGPRWVRAFFTIPATIFIFVLATNLFGLLVGIPLTGLGICEEHHAVEAAEGAEADVAAETEVANAEEARGTCAPGQIIVPFFRAPAADLNFTLALALITQVAAWVFGFTALGVGGYLGKFFVLGGMTSAKSLGDFMMGLISFLVGLLEFLSEFVRIIAYTFRLFGNIFAGEVMLLVIMFLVPLVVVTPLIGFEIFVNFIQAFIFYILSVAFYTVAITGHGDHDESHEAHH